MHLLCCMLSVWAGGHFDADSEASRVGSAVPLTTGAPLPASAVIPESVPTARAKLPDRSGSWLSRDWIVSLEGATHAPVDVGVQGLVETPFRIHVSAGYGWVPSAYSGLVSGIAATASGNALAGAILNHTTYQGTTLRGQAGVRPFRSLGLYADFGLARLDVEGALDLADTGVAALRTLGGGYRAHTTIDMWLVEVGSQHEFWDSVIMGLALGVMGTFDARTSIVAVNGAPSSPLLDEAAKQTDAALKTYGFVPTITLRLGYDFFSLHRWLAADPPAGT
jgi:hypothetical protein